MTPDQVLSLYRDNGRMQYAGEPINQIQHGWQCARLANRAGASEELQLAAWLHDIGHLLVGLPGSPTMEGINDRHEIIGASALSAIWGDAVAEPVRLHVLAKRYLVSTKPEYFAKLSADSVRSLELQGGKMDPHEIDDFLSQPYHEQAILIRVWDDAGKSDDPHDAFSAELQLADLQQLLRKVKTLAC